VASGTNHAGGRENEGGEKRNNIGAGMHANGENERKKEKSAKKSVSASKTRIISPKQNNGGEAKRLSAENEESEEEAIIDNRWRRRK
jgi:hypothetical protein